MGLLNLRIRFLWALDHAWVIALVLPFFYLLTNVTYFSKDDNFSQFTPVFKYAFEALMNGELPWMHPGELGSRLAESPYYAIFSPILFIAFLITHLFQLEPYWIINIWALIYLTLINLLLIKFANGFSIPSYMKSTLIVCAGLGSFMAQFSVNWYYVLPPLLLLITKIDYWQYFLTHQNSSKKNDALLLVVTYLAVYGGNPQLYFYIQVVELIFLAPLLTKRIYSIYFRNQVISALLLAPWLYCQFTYWSESWRTIYNANSIHIFKFIKSGLFLPYQAEGQSIWIVGCLVYLALWIFRRKKFIAHDPLSISLAFTSLLLLLASAIDVGTLFGKDYPIAQFLTTPNKWWFLGGITSVFAICLWSKTWSRRWQIYFASFALITSGIYITHQVGKAAYLWGNLDYAQVNTSIQILQKNVDANSRVLQLTNFRNTDPHPSSHLLLNTWLTGDFKNLVFAKGYETVQAKENKRREIAQYFESQHLSLKQYQDLGVSALWVNKKEYPKTLFDTSDYLLVYEDQNHYLVKLVNPGFIVGCENSDCKAYIEFHPNRILVDVNNFSVDDIVQIKITPYSNFSITAKDSGQPIPHFICGDHWLCFKPIKGIEAYQINYKDTPFIVLLLASNAVFLLLLLLLYLRPQQR